MAISSSKQYKNILIVKLSAIGDVIHALPVAHALKQKYPQARITWIVEKPAYDLLTNNPDIDEIILFDKPRFKSVSGLVSNVPELSRQLKSRNFDVVLDLQGLFKSAAIAWLSGAAERYGYCNMRELSHLLSAPICGDHQDGHIVERYLDVARALGCKVEMGQFSITITDQEAVDAQESMKKAGITENTCFVVLAPGTNWPTKCWPIRSYGELADQLYAEGITPVIIGGPADKQLAEEILATAKRPVIDLVGKTTLKQLAYVIKQARIFVGGDTGPMHLAVAVGTSVVAMFGPTDPGRNGPYSGENIVLTATGKCCGCWQRKCDKNYECMTNITVGEVLEAVKKIASK